MNGAVATPLNDIKSFLLVPGLWKGVKPPLVVCAVLRSTNFRSDGLFDYGDVAELPVEDRLLHERRLFPGDIVIERSGGGPKQPVGRVALFDPPDDRVYCTSNFTTALRVINHDEFDPTFVSLVLHALYLAGITETLQRATTGIRNLDWSEYLRLQIARLPIGEQRALARLIAKTRKGYLNEDRALALLGDLKQATMQALFTRGLQSEAQKETEIGPVPESWVVESLGTHHSVVSGGTPSRNNPAYWQGGTIPWVKTTEVDYRVIRETEEFITQAGLDRSAAKLLPVGTLLLAMYGQGITRGKVAILGIEAACNQACAAIKGTDETVDSRYLYHFLTYRYDDIRQLAHGGQQQNLNLDIVRSLPLTFSPDLDAQRQIAALLDRLDQKIEIHRRKRSAIDELFKALLNELAAGELRHSDLELLGLDPERAPEVAA